VLRAHLDYNQREYESVLVSSHFDEDTSKLFRNLQKSSSCFTDQGVSQLKLAAELTALSRKGSGGAHGASSNPRNFRPFANRGRGSRFYGNRSGRGQGRSDVFHNLAANYPPISHIMMVTNFLTITCRYAILTSGAKLVHLKR